MAGVRARAQLQGPRVAGVALRGGAVHDVPRGAVLLLLLGRGVARAELWGGLRGGGSSAGAVEGRVRGAGANGAARDPGEGDRAGAQLVRARAGRADVVHGVPRVGPATQRPADVYRPDLLDDRRAEGGRPEHGAAAAVSTGAAVDER